MPHEHQTNDYTADQSMAYVLGHPFTWQAPLGSYIRGSENQKLEAALAALLQNPNSQAARRTFSARLVDGQGNPLPHQGGEFATASHSPHWYRLMSVARLWSLRNPHVTDIFNAVARWWAEDRWIRDMYRVPYGPLKNQIIGWGARDGAFKGHNDLRDVIDGLVESRMTTKSAHYFVNAKNTRDDFGAYVVQTIIHEFGIDTFTSLVAVKPLIEYDLAFEKTFYYLLCTCGNPDPGSPKTIRVDYAAGTVTLT